MGLFCRKKKPFIKIEAINETDFNIEVDWNSSSDDEENVKLIKSLSNILIGIGSRAILKNITETIIDTGKDKGEENISDSIIRVVFSVLSKDKEVAYKKKYVMSPEDVFKK